MNGWHFAPDTMTLAHGDGRPIVDGETLTVEGEIVPCKNALHASERIVDALVYVGRAGTERVCLCRVTLSGIVVEDGDKYAASMRTCGWHLSPDETERVLCVLARQCAADVLHLWDAPDVVRKYLCTGDESWRAAAAWAAAKGARAVFQITAWSAADAAARAAVEDARGAAAAVAAARAAAWAAKGTTAWTVRDAQERHAQRLVAAAHEGRWNDVCVIMPDEGERR